LNEALLITTGSVLLGAGLAVLTARDNVVLLALRTFAIAAVVCGVMVQLLPEAVEAVGGWALVAFVGALALPALVAPLLQRLLGGRSAMSSHGIGVELGYLGFALHQLAEGIALGTYSGGAHDGHDHGNLVLAVAAHTVPLTAVFIGLVLARSGPKGAVWRTLGLVVATVLGFAAADGLHDATSAFHGWLSAAVAGFLCHVLLHDPGVVVRRTKTAGTLDVAAASIGIALPLWAVYAGAAHAGDAVREAVGEAFVELVLETAPMLLLGLLLGAGLQVMGSRIPGRWLMTGGAARQALRGIAVGAPLPLCACGVLPIAESLRKRGAGPALVIAFLVATPELGPETLTLTVRFLGWPFAVVRLLAALLLAFIAAMVFARLVGSRTAVEGEPTAARSMIVPPGKSGWRSVIAHFDELLLHTAPWTFVGLLAAAYIAAVIPAESLAPLADRGLDVFVVGLVAMPTYVCAASATPLAAVLLLKGVSPGAVLVGLLLGPATNVATIGVLRRGYGTRPVLVWVCAVLLASFALGWLVNLSALGVDAPHQLDEDHHHGIVAIGSLLLLGLVLVGQLFRWGTRPWFEILQAGGHGHDHDHGHHHHGHDHGHHHHHHGHDHGHHHHHDP
jgi:uncharacterized protein